MGSFWLEFLVIFILILANGFFSGSELAILSMRRSRTKELIRNKSLKAKLVGQLQDNPDRFLATVQIGVTVIGTLASAFGGASAIQYLKPAFEKVPVLFFQRYSQQLALAVVVVVISYLSLVLGELVPKSLALRFSEKISLWVAFPIQLLSKLSFIFIKILTISSNLFLFFLPKQARHAPARLTENEIRILLSEGVESGAIEQAEHKLIENIFEFTDLISADVLVAKSDVLAFNINSDLQSIIKTALASGHAKFPVYQENIDNIVGVLYVKDLLQLLEDKKTFDLRSIIRETYFVPETKKIMDLMREMQENRIHLAVVINEYGGMEGIITMEDILDEITGELAREEERETEDYKILADGTILLKGSMQVKKFNRRFDAGLPEDEEYKTMAGFLSHVAGHIPEVNESIHFGVFAFVIVKKLRHRIQQIKVKQQ